MPKLLHMDYETRSTLNLKDCGLDRYMKHPSTQPLMCAYAFDDGPVKMWCCWTDEKMPAELRAALLDPTVKKGAWNYNFERDCTEYKAGIPIPQGEWFDPSVLCSSMSLPIGLDRAARALGVEHQKMGEGKKYVKMFSSPTKATKKMLKNGSPEFYFKDWNSHPEEWAQFVEYCRMDVEAERAVYHAAVALNCPMTDEEHNAWLLDQRMNKTGVFIDQQYVTNAKKLAETESDLILAEIKSHTGLDNPNSRDQLIGWCRERGYPYDSLDKEHLAESLKGDLKPLLRAILELKQKLGGSAYKKLESILERMGIDGRLRDQFVYHGAHTGRWCIAEGSSIRVKTPAGGVCDKPIEMVSLDDLVWDGTMWVSHDGVVFSGEKSIMEYDGVKATPEHEVWITATCKTSLANADNLDLSIWKGANMPYIIYRLTSPSDKFYIGLTKSSLKTRWQQHRAKARKTSINHPLYNAIRKYGPESFIVEIIDYADNKQNAQMLEMTYIAAQEPSCLYNLSAGGEADGETGSKIFWDKMNNNPAAKETYLQKLSDIKKNADWSDYENMAKLAEEWRRQNPRRAYELTKRARRAAARKRPTKQKDTRPLIDRLRWMHNRSGAITINTTRIWAERTLEQKQEIAKKISIAAKKRFATLSLEERRAITAKARETHIQNVANHKAAL
jgi:group I intron endonuclease